MKAHGHHIDSSSNVAVSVLAVQTGDGRESGSQAKAPGAGAKITEGNHFTPEVRDAIINSMLQVNDASLYGASIREYAALAIEGQVSDYELQVAILEIQIQVQVNPVSLKKILGDQFEFISTAFKDACS